jgi:Domain of unknown function (DUF6457)
VTQSSDAAALSAWVSAVAKELGIEQVVDAVALVDTVLDLTSDVAHGVSRPAAPVTAFLVGIAAGRADAPAEAVRAYADQVGRLADDWSD